MSGNRKPPAGKKQGLVPLLLRFLAPYKRELALAVLAQAVAVTANLYLPTLNAQVIDQGVLAGDTDYIWNRGAIMLGVTLASALAGGLGVYLGARTAMGVGRDVRRAVFEKTQTFSAHEFARFTPASLITRTTNDVQQIQMLVLMAVTMLLTAPIMAIVGIGLAMGQDVPLAAVLLVSIPVLIAVMALIIRAMIPAYKAMQPRLDGVNRIIREHIGGIRVIRAFVRDDHERERFAEGNDRLREVALRVGRVQAFFGATAMAVGALSTIAVVAIGGQRVMDESLPIGSMIAFISYLGLILGAVMMSLSIFMLGPRAKVSADRIGEVLAAEPVLHEPEHAPERVPETGTITLSGVGFRYPGAEESVLRGIDLTVPGGGTTAIVGSTGSGKSTLLNLIPRLMGATEGRVAIDGVDVRDLDRDTLSGLIGVVPQKGFIFTGTIATNLRFGRADATDEELWEALRVAQAAEFVSDMPDGLDTAVGQGGTTVSGGQRQRLSIARALVARPRIYLFDDSFSALDTATDAALRAALDEHFGDAAGTSTSNGRDPHDVTRVIVAQRVSTIRGADRIAVLDEGRLAGVGTHSELLESSPVYREIAESQLSADELQEAR
ncbi:ABC transporter ATP-binding protein [Salininema proteolyticum]|uniref:ABC transporter ATP-binding protein n=1 Tax=Salininema proteolyticum TaxID=1607685 RepID=A0ABV8U620_9ACTN